MSLTERLAAAAKARGVSPAPPLASPAAHTSRTTAPGGRIHIVMRPTTPVAAVEPDPSVAADAICPTCSRTGTIGTIDLARRTADWACEGCGTSWRIGLATPTELEADATAAVTVGAPPLQR
jgi:ribosomal protein L37AE/L43A